MQIEGLSPDGATYVGMLKACGSIGAADKGGQLLIEIAAKGLSETNIIVGNALLDMYFKCGLPSEAHLVFNNLDFRDIVSWNTLMVGYINNEQPEKALKLYEKMQLDNVIPNVATHVCGVKACGLVGATVNGQEIHAELSRCYLLEKNIVVGNSLIDMYAKWGWVAKAQEVFDKLTRVDVQSWNALISGYSQMEYGEEILKCFNKMQSIGVVPDAITYVMSLKACASIGDAEKGNEIHCDIERLGVAKENIVIGTALLDMYAKCGWLAHAQEVFNDFPTRDLISWNALIAGYVDNENAQEVFVCLEQMYEEKISPNSATFAWCLKACGILKMPGKGCEFHAEIARKGWLDSDILLSNSLVEMFAKCGWLNAAQEIFNKLFARDAACWTALIEGYNDIGYGEEGLRYFEQMQLEGIIPDGVSMACALKSCGSIQAAQQGKALHAKWVATGVLESDFIAGSVLVCMYADCGLLREAQIAFNSFQVRDNVSWNSLIASYTRYELEKEAYYCIEEMETEGVKADMITEICRLRACFDSNKVDESKGIYDDKSIGSFKNDLFLCNTLVDVYAKSGCLLQALELVNSLPNRDIISWNTLISGFNRHECNEYVIHCLQQIDSDGILPDNVTFVSGLKACGKICATKKGTELHAEIARRGLFESDVLMSNALMDMYVKCGSILKAEEVFDCITSRDLISWNTLISGFMLSGDNGRVFSLFDRMRREGQQPDSATFASILRCCSQAVQMERCELLLESMGKYFGISPSLKHYTCVIGLLARCGCLHQAAFRIINLPFDPDTIVLLTVLDACRKLGIKQLGQINGYTKHPGKSSVAALLF
ncbi:hypothetical protein KP509_06G069000 [Ceratopteris richardii]|nr:hypothetical protein KP509_06G069000 [Ceratopteris richardii]